MGDATGGLSPAGGPAEEGDRAPEGDAVLRLFRPEDQEAARDLILAGLGEHFGHIDRSCNPDLDDIGQNYPAAGHVFVVAELRGQIIGTAGLRMGRREAQLVRLSVAPSWRGQGLGRRLVTHLLALADQAGMEAVIVETNRDWMDAIRLYRASQFYDYAGDAISVYMRRNLKGEREDARTM